MKVSGKFHQHLTNIVLKVNLLPQKLTACKKNFDVYQVKLFLESGADINFADMFGETALMKALMVCLVIECCLFVQSLLLSWKKRGKSVSRVFRPRKRLQK